MDVIIFKLPNSQLKILRVLWDAEREMTLAEIREAASAVTSWEPTTIKTLLSRLCKKGVVKQDKREVTYFSPAISSQQYSDYATKEMIDSLYGGNAKNLVCALLDNEHLSKSDIKDLRELFKVTLLKEGD